MTAPHLLLINTTTLPNDLVGSCTFDLVCCRCDRILWRGEGMDQHWYARGESRFSDHRPVSSLFSARLTDADGNKPAALRGNFAQRTAARGFRRRSTMPPRAAAVVAAPRCAVEAEEMLLVPLSSRF
jgi:hypothetical protein